MNLIPTLKITSQLAKKIRQHSAESYPDECCGALLGRDEQGEGSTGGKRTILEVLPLVNRSAAIARNRFSISAEDVRDVEILSLARGLDVVGWYHSHPDHPAKPSEYDRQHAWPWYSYVIVGVLNGEPEDLTAWRLNDDGQGYSQQAIELQYGVSI
ncbi:MAG: M67 family metallopeptidase [Candidatus Acidiferrum sp.]